MFTLDEKTKLISFPKIEGLGFDSLETLVCEDPYCNCSNGNLLVVEKKNKKHLTAESAALIGVNYGQNTLVYNENMEISETAKAKTQQTISFFQENMTAEDWKLLSGLGRYQKMMSIEFLPHDEHYKYEFSEEQKDLDLKISFEEIYPACQRFSFIDDNGDSCEIIDLHCKKPYCKCQNIHIQVYKNSEYMYDFEYDYGHNAIISGTDKDNILAGIKTKTPKLNMRLAKRNELIRDLARKNLMSNSNSGGTLKKVKIGRNAACPCGSGKKYKRCCLKK